MSVKSYAKWNTRGRDSMEQLHCTWEMMKYLEISWAIFLKVFDLLAVAALCGYWDLEVVYPVDHESGWTNTRFGATPPRGGLYRLRSPLGWHHVLTSRTAKAWPHPLRLHMELWPWNHILGMYTRENVVKKRWWKKILSYHDAIDSQQPTDNFPAPEMAKSWTRFYSKGL